MTLLPFESITLETTLSKDETIAILSRNIEPEKVFRLFNTKGTKYFEGRLNGNEFEIKRIISYKNSFLPTVTGRIETYENGTRLTISMRLHPLVTTFMGVWFFFVGLAFFVSLGSENSFSFVVPLGMLLFGYVLTMGCYWYESNRAKELIQKLIDARLSIDVRRRE